MSNCFRNQTQLDVSYGGGLLELECLGLSLVRIMKLPEYPDVLCLNIRAVQALLGDNKVETIFYVVPIKFVTKLELAALPKGLRFQPPTKKMFVPADKTPPKNPMPEARVLDRLAEFGVAIE